jgi:asparaginyl-tRNA synthetase
MLEAEVGFLDTLDGLLDVIEAGMKDVLRQIVGGLETDVGGDGRLENTRRRRRSGYEGDMAVISEALSKDLGEVEVMNRHIELQRAATLPFARITYTDAIALLGQQHETTPFVRPPKWGQSLSSEHERWLASRHNLPTFITHYPKSLKPFYMLPSTVDPTFDASMPQGETVACFAGGSLREHRLPELMTSLKDHGLKREDYEWYLDLRRFGSVPHGGWGMGWERWICWVTGVVNVRDVVAFPRWFGSCKY